MSISLIAAASANKVIGINNKLPWDLPKESAYFYEMVYNKPIVMGRKTYEALGAAIKNSKNYVLSANQNLKLPDCTVINSIDVILDLSRQTNDEIMIIGGASVYQQFLPFADKIYLTIIEQDFVGDAYFPDWSKDDWKITNQRRIISEAYPYNLLILQKI